MPKIDDLSSGINEGCSKIDEAITIVTAVKDTADELASIFTGLNADGQTNAMNDVSQQLRQAIAVLSNTNSQLRNAQQMSELTKKGLVTKDSTTPLPPTTAPTIDPNYPINASHTISWSDLCHVVYGDDNDETSGGHLYGTGRPGKTEFPPGWDEEDIKNALVAAAAQPLATEARPRSKWVAVGIHRGVTVKAVVRRNGTIEAGWPSKGLDVKQNPR